MANDNLYDWSGNDSAETPAVVEEPDSTEQATEPTKDGNGPEEPSPDKFHVDESQVNSPENANPGLFDYSDVIEKPPKPNADGDGQEESEDENTDADDNDPGVNKAAADDNDPGSSNMPAPAPAVIDPGLIMRAGKAGLTADDLKAFATPEALTQAVILMERSAPRQGGDSAAAEEPKVEEFKPFELEIPEDFDDESASVLKKMQEQFNMLGKAMHEKAAASEKELIELKGTLQQDRQAAEQQARVEFTKWFDDELSQRADEWGDLLGSEQIGQLPDNDPKVINRQKVVIEMDNLARAHPEWDRNRLLQGALTLTFPDQIEKRAVSKVKQKASQHRQNRVTARPSSRVPQKIEDMPKGREKAIAVAKSWWKKNFS